MKEINYPDFELHKKIHEDFKDEINEYIKLFEKKDLQKIKYKN